MEIPDFSGEKAQQSAQDEPVSGTSGVGNKRLPPTTSQQDQSANKKPKKSKNENEGDVSTILQESDESADQSAQGEPVSGTSGVGYKRLPPTTSQQDQSAKQKPKKSNNENEGDVSTIPQESDESRALSNKRKSILTYPKGMHAVLGRITVTVLPKMCQQILESIISADNLYCSFQNRNDLKIILVEEELEIINTMVSNGYKHFTIQLCYKILRHEQWVGKPRQDWGNVPIQTDIHISDDIERIRLSRNKIVSMETKSLDKTTFLTLIDEFKEIAKRVDFYLKKDVKFLLQIQKTESMTKAEIESTVEEIRRLPVIEDNPFPVRTINQGRTNYARLGLVVVEIFQNILREIMRSNIAPEVLHRHIIKQQQNNPSVFRKMTHEESKSLNTLSNRTYDNIEFTTSYKLMRSLLLIDDPTQGWGKQPTNVDVTISDDVERLRNVRNKIVHRIKADIDLIEMNNYFSNIVHITERIDTYLCKLPDQGFAREVLNFQTHCMDSEMEQKYYQALKDIEDIKEKFSVGNVHFYYGKTFSNLIQDVQNEAKSSVIPITLVLEDINDDKKQMILNQLKTEINSGLVNIKFKQAVSGSLIIYIDILDSNMLSTEHELGHQIYHFLCSALQLMGFNMKTENEINVVLIKEEDDIEVEFSIEIDNWETYDEEISLRPNTLCLELDVNTEICNTEQKMQSNFGFLVKSVLSSNGKSNIESVSARLEPGIVAQQSTQVEPVSGTSGVEYKKLHPTTSQQDQSAKKKPKKSNNENEGDVSTILEESDQSDEDEAEALSRKENNFLRLYFLCNKIATQAVQVFFDRQVPGHTLESFLKQHKPNLTSHRSVYRCTKDQEAKLFPGGQVVVVSTDFDFTLLYKLIRNLLTAIPAPTCGWGMQPLPGHLNETDDIERIRYLRSSLAHNSDFEICDTDFSTHWTDLSQAIDRLSKGSLSTDVESMRTKKFDKCIINEMEEDIRKEEKKTQEKFMSECSTDIADNKQKIYDIDDRHIPLNIQNEADFLSKGGNNFIRLQLLCQKIGTQAVRIFFDSKVPGHTLKSFLKQHKSNLTSHGSIYRCTKDQVLKMFPGGQVGVASADFDFTLLYKLIRNLLMAIPPPTCGWGNWPSPGHLNEADDIERIRHSRNYLANNSDLEICDTDFSIHWTNLSEAIDRLSKGSLSTDVESLRTKRFDIRSSLLSQYHYSMLNRLLGHGSYESFEMRVMVTGQFGVGKTSLVMILVGDEAPHEAQSTDGISLLEGRCGLDIENRDWILIAKDDYNARDVIYQKVLMTPDPKDKATGQYKPTKTEDATLKRHHPEQAIPKDIDTKLPTMVWPEKAEAVKIDKKSESEEMVELKQMKSKMTRKEIKKQMEKALKQGDYKMKVGRLLFWDFGGQYVYYTTHQAFMTYRALFLVVFDGSTDLYDEVPDVLCFPGQHGTPTPAVFLQHWVNSILTYCKVISGEIPQILFVATHKDKIAEKDVEERRTSIYNEIDQLFKSHDGRNHLVLKHRVFVNAMNKNDPEIEILKEIITELTFNHPCWGEKMPNVWIPLELEIAELTAEGRQIMSLKEIEELNNASEVSTLSSEDLKTFLQIQHSLGKIVYFDTPQLKDYVVISPLYMVEVMKSFVTDRQFWPKDSKGKETFNKMSVHGVIEKSDLFSLWERKEFSKILLYKEYVFDMLVHLDILSEQRRYDQYTGSRLPVEDFFVPCMVTEQYTTNYMENECTPQRAICFAFVFKGSTIPPALPNRLIGACLSMWHLKTYEGKKLMFSGFIGLTIDKSHDIIVRVESNKILLFILHKTSKGLIVRDIATGVKECLYTTLERILEFYQSASNKNSSQQQPFHVELACSNFKCFLPETEAKASENNHVICEGCNQNYEIEIWNQDKKKDNCHQNCTGLSEEALVQHPSDCEILRFSDQFNTNMIRELVIHLGLSASEWENMREDHPCNTVVVKFLILIKWREQNTGIFRDLAEALTAMDDTTHKLCQVRRDKRAKNRDLLAEHMDYIPTDEILDALAPEIGKISFNLGIELGLRAVDLERIQHDYERNLVNQTKQVLYEWRNDTTVKATLGVLEQALVNVGRGAMCLKTVVETIGVDKRHNFRQQSI